MYMYKTNLKQLSRIEKKYKNSPMVLNIISDSLNIFYSESYSETVGQTITHNPIRTKLLLDLNIIKTKKEKSKIKKEKKYKTSSKK